MSFKFTNATNPSLFLIILCYQISLDHLSGTSQAPSDPPSSSCLCSHCLAIIPFWSFSSSLQWQSKAQKNTEPGASLMPYDVKNISVPLTVHALACAILLQHYSNEYTPKLVQKVDSHSLPLLMHGPSAILRIEILFSSLTFSSPLLPWCLPLWSTTISYSPNQPTPIKGWLLPFIFSYLPQTSWRPISWPEIIVSWCSPPSQVVNNPDSSTLAEPTTSPICSS